MTSLDDIVSDLELVMAKHVCNLKFGFAFDGKLVQHYHSMLHHASEIRRLRLHFNLGSCASNDIQVLSESEVGTRAVWPAVELTSGIHWTKCDTSDFVIVHFLRPGGEVRAQ